MDTLPQPLVSSPDSEGFQTFSLYAPNGEILRVSFNVTRQGQYLNMPISFDEYSPIEQAHLRMAARVAIARGEVPTTGSSIVQQEVAALSILHRKANETALSVIQEQFPALATVALQLANDVCIKRSLNQVVTEYGTPRIYDEAAFDLLVKNLKAAIKDSVIIRPGHPPEGPERLRKIRNALANLSAQGHSKPTQETIAAEIETEPRTVRQWISDLGITWKNLLSQYQWHPGKREKRKAAGK